MPYKEIVYDLITVHSILYFQAVHPKLKYNFTHCSKMILLFFSYFLTK